MGRRGGMGRTGRTQRLFQAEAPAAMRARGQGKPRASISVSSQRGWGPAAGEEKLGSIHDKVIGCDLCPRLRTYCQDIARTKRRAFRDETYWARPVPGFGDPSARVLIVGLAPAAHGANRTGRVFTGDGIGGSGD